jgi:hypothetical protein
MASKKQNTLSITLANLDGLSGINVTGFIPFSDFADEKEGSEYTVYLDPETNKTVPAGTPGAIAETRKATPNRNFRTNFTDPEVIWPDGNMRTISLRLKANNPIDPADYDAKKAAATDERVLTMAASASADAKRRLLEQLKHDLGE